MQRTGRANFEVFSVLLIFNFLKFCQAFWLHNHPCPHYAGQLKSATKSTKNAEATKVEEKVYEVLFVFFASFVMKPFLGCTLGCAAFSAISMVEP